MGLRGIMAGVLAVSCGMGLVGCDWVKILTLGNKTGWELPNDPSTALAPQVRVGEIVPPPAEGRKMVSRAPFGDRVAYIRATPDAKDREMEHIFIDVGLRTWEVLGMPFPGRPMENLHWEGQILVVERWRTPTEGVRVHIDAGQGKGILAEAISREAPTTQP